MATESHVLRVRRFYEELWNRGNLAAADELASRECVRHDPSGPVPPGPEGFKQTASRLRTAFPDLHLSIDFVVAEGAMVVARWTIRGTHAGPLGPMAATGTRVEFSGVNIFRMADGRIAEIWNHRDDLSLYQQLGAIPPPPSPGPR